MAMNKRVSCGDPSQNIFRLGKRGSRGDGRLKISIHNKRAQFFILSAVIIAAIIVSITSVHNYVGSADAPKKFYYYSQQLEDETGAVVDYALYSDPTGGNVGTRDNLNRFLQLGIAKMMEAYPDMELFACYSNPTDPNNLICQNNGTRSIRVNVSTVAGGSVSLAGKKELICNLFSCSNVSVGTLFIKDKTLVTVTPNGSKSYNIPLGNSSIQRGQFYFIARLNTTGGEYVSSSGDQKESLE